MIGRVVRMCAALAATAGCLPESDVPPVPPDALERSLAALEHLAREFPPPGEDPLEWPRDHASKSGQFLESWLYAGVVRDGAGARTGFQLSFQRIAVHAQPGGRESAWAATEAYRARFSVEPAGARAQVEERLSRGALGLAGAGSDPVVLWLEDWRATLDEDGRTLRLEGRSGDAALDLRLSLPGRNALAIDGERHRGYWWPGLAVTGALEVDGRRVAVTGEAMLERLWGRVLPMGRGQLSLARLWLDVGDGAWIRCERLQRRGGGGMPLLECLGRPTPFGEGLALEPDARGWRTLAAVEYPLRWTVRGPALRDPLELAPLSRPAAAPPGAGWGGIVVVTGEDGRWGMLELSNFVAP